MDKTYKPEGMESLISIDQVIAVIRKRGCEDPEAVDLVTRWTIQEEKRADIENTAKARIEIDLLKVLFYVAVGDFLGADEHLEFARLAAGLESLDGILEDLIAKLDNETIERLESARLEAHEAHPDNLYDVIISKRWKDRR